MTIPIRSRFPKGSIPLFMPLVRAIKEIPVVCLNKYRGAVRKSYSGGDGDDGLTCIWSMEDDTCVGTDKLFQELHVL